MYGKTYSKKVSTWKLILRGNRLRIFLREVNIYDRNFISNMVAKAMYDSLKSVKDIKKEMELSSYTNDQILKDKTLWNIKN
ncbi:MAG: hypothetical protein ACFFG0_41255 [Candidatus Thorarchaeota archaeon]